MRIAAGALALLLASGSLRPVRSAGADDAGVPHATLTCDRLPSPGRVRCEVDAQVDPGESIGWGDVVILRTPPFTTALRGRVGPHEATLREAERWRWAFALVARDRGTGQIEGRVRLVVCRAGVCTPRELPVAGAVAVGSE